MSRKSCLRIQNFGMFALIMLLVWTVFMASANAGGLVAYHSNRVTVVLPFQTEAAVVREYREVAPVYRYESTTVYQPSRAAYDDGYYAGRRESEIRRTEEIRWKIEQRERERIRRQEEFDSGYRDGYVTSR